MLLISSIIKTVFPTPAPPNNPIFPPLIYGANKSITFIPVSNISVSVSKSSNSGASLWIGKNVSAFIGPWLSTGSPKTFNILPRTALPTGIVIGFPVSITSIPLFNPSVESIATVLTTLLPRCCSTSRTSSLSSNFTFKALYIAGNSSLKATSTTALIICVIVPLFTYYCLLILLFLTL